jgi:UDP-glucuronate decarboxylase
LEENPIVRKDLQFIASSLLPWHLLKKKRILITGANGFLSNYLIRTLLYLNEESDLGLEIIALVRNKEKARLRFGEMLNIKEMHLIVNDVSNKIEKIPGEINIIIHAASQASPKYYGSDPVGTLKANTIGTYNLLELAREKESESFLLFSTSEVYGDIPESNLPIKEEFYGYLDPLNVRSCYAESKRMAETMCVSWFHQFGVAAKIVRPFHTYGPGMALNDGRVFSDFVSDVIQSKDIIMKSDGSAMRAFCYLADATAGFFSVLLKGECSQAYNVGNDNGEISIIELAQLLVHLYPEKHLKIINKIDLSSGYIPSKVKRACPSIEKIKRLGWAPSFSIADGFKRTIDSFCQ